MAAERARATVAARPFPGGARLTLSAGVCDLETAGGSRSQEVCRSAVGPAAQTLLQMLTRFAPGVPVKRLLGGPKVPAGPEIPDGTVPRPTEKHPEDNQTPESQPRVTTLPRQQSRPGTAHETHLVSPSRV